MFIANPYTFTAKDTSIGIQLHQRSSNVSRGLHPVSDKSAFRLSNLVDYVLEVTLACLVAYRTVKGMMD